MQRRDFMKNAALAGAGLFIAPSGTFGANGSNNKLNIALIGSWGRGEAHFSSIATENVVALCDINDEHLAFGAKRFPQAKTYNDWRKLLDDHKALSLDAVVICTADHTHAFIANWALNRNLHVYCEKPLAISVEEARTVRANWLTKKAKLATQVGMQRHAYANFNRLRELILDGAIGELKSASAWGNRQCRPDLCDYDQEKGIVYFKEGKTVAGYLPDAGAPPSQLHYDLWLGPSPAHAYNPGYFSRGPGANCLSWNMFWDFGAGQIGDMGSHTMDLLWNCVDAKLPTSAEAKGDPFNAAITPIKCESHFEHPANDWRGPINVSWYQGGAMPTAPKEFIDLKKIGHGAMFKGTQGYIIADLEQQTRLVFPYGKEADMSYYKPRAKDKMLPPLGHFQQQWIDACKNPSLKTACDFEYSGNMIEQLLLGLVAYRAGKKIAYDGATGKVTNCPEANALLSRKYRDGWVLNG